MHKNDKLYKIYDFISDASSLFHYNNKPRHENTYLPFAKPKSQSDCADDQHLCFRYILVHFLYFLNPNFTPLAIFRGCTARLCRTWLKIPKKGFLMARLISCIYLFNRASIKYIIIKVTLVAIFSTSLCAVFQRFSVIGNFCRHSFLPMETTRLLLNTAILF